MGGILSDSDGGPPTFVKNESTGKLESTKNPCKAVVSEEVR